MRETDVFVLSEPKGGTIKLQPSQSAAEMPSMMCGMIRAKKQRIEKLTEQLENVLGRPVIDKTGMTGEYDWELPLSRVDKTVLPNAVREKLRLELTKKKQPVEMLIVEKSTTKRKVNSISWLYETLSGEANILLPLA